MCPGTVWGTNHSAPRPRDREETPANLGSRLEHPARPLRIDIVKILHNSTVWWNPCTVARLISYQQLWEHHEHAMQPEYLTETDFLSLCSATEAFDSRLEKQRFLSWLPLIRPFYSLLCGKDALRPSWPA
ncbi:hypothetical protein VTO42DRAFT_7972 [Malbranchea cinnamomea]